MIDLVQIATVWRQLSLPVVLTQNEHKQKIVHVYTLVCNITSDFGHH